MLKSFWNCEIIEIGLYCNCLKTCTCFFAPHGMNSCLRQLCNQIKKLTLKVELEQPFQQSGSLYKKLLTIYDMLCEKVQKLKHCKKYQFSLVEQFASQFWFLKLINPNLPLTCECLTSCSLWSSASEFPSPAMNHITGTVHPIFRQNGILPGGTAETRIISIPPFRLFWLITPRSQSIDWLIGCRLAECQPPQDGWPQCILGNCN